jgi:anti-sigma factor RsiW
MARQIDDFDDGGTPGWRRQAAPVRRGIRAWWRRLPFLGQFLVAEFLAFGLPWGIIIFGILGLVAWDAIFGR